MKLTFGKANAKLIKLQNKIGKKIHTFSILSGYSCPYAKDCESRAIQHENGSLTIQDGPHTVFRCFSASQEVLFKNVYKSRKDNLELIKSCNNDTSKIVDLIQQSLPKKLEVLRIHVAGDFHTKNYFHAWMIVARNNPNVIFYAYTKSLPFWIAFKNEIPDNFILTASYGGYKDKLIEEHNLRYVRVINSKIDANDYGLPIDSDDDFAYNPSGRHINFALYIHGPQPKGSDAGKAVRKLKGVGSYSRAKNMKVYKGSRKLKVK